MTTPSEIVSIERFSGEGVHVSGSEVFLPNAGRVVLRAEGEFVPLAVVVTHSIGDLDTLRAVLAEGAKVPEAALSMKAVTATAAEATVARGGDLDGRDPSVVLAAMARVAEVRGGGVVAGSVTANAVEMACGGRTWPGAAVSSSTMYVGIEVSGPGAVSCDWGLQLFTPTPAADPALGGLSVGSELRVSCDDWHLATSARAEYVVLLGTAVAQRGRDPSFALTMGVAGVVTLRLGVQDAATGGWVASRTHTFEVRVVTSGSEAATLAGDVVKQLDSDEGVPAAERVGEAAAALELLGAAAGANGTDDDVRDVLSAVDGLMGLTGGAGAHETGVALADAMADTLLGRGGSISYGGEAVKLTSRPVSAASPIVSLEGTATTVVLEGVAATEEQVVVKAVEGSLYPQLDGEVVAGDVVQVKAERSNLTMVVNFAVDSAWVYPYPCDIALRVWNASSGEWGEPVDLMWNGALTQDMLDSPQPNPSCGAGVSGARAAWVQGANGTTVNLTSRSALGTVGVFVGANVMPSTNLRRLFSTSNFETWENVSEDNIATLAVIGSLYVAFYLLLVASWCYDRAQDHEMERRFVQPSDSALQKRGERASTSLRSEVRLQDLCTSFDERSTMPDHFRTDLVFPRNESIVSADTVSDVLRSQRPDHLRTLRPSQLSIAEVGSDAPSHSGASALSNTPVSVDLSDRRKLSIAGTEPEEPITCCGWTRFLLRKIGKAMGAHLWLSFLFRQPGQEFTRPQRLTILFCAMNTVVFTMALFCGQAEKNATVPKLAMVAVLAACLMTPTTVLLGLLFKRATKKKPVLWEWAAMDPYPMYPVRGELKVRVIEARDLPMRDGDDIPDCFVLVESECRVWKSCTVWDDHNPVYDATQCIMFPTRDESALVVVNVYDDDGGQETENGDLVASLSISMGDVVSRIICDDTSATAALDCWYPIDDELSREQGRHPEIRIICEYTQYGSPEFDSIGHKEWWDNEKVEEFFSSVLSEGNPEDVGSISHLQTAVDVSPTASNTLQAIFAVQMSPKTFPRNANLKGEQLDNEEAPIPMPAAEGQHPQTQSVSRHRLPAPVTNTWENEEEEKEETLCRRMKENAKRSMQFVLFLLLVHVGVMFLMGWRWLPLVVCVFVVLAVATFFVVLFKAIVLLVMVLGVYGCVLLMDGGSLGLGVGLAFAWVMVFVAIEISASRPKLLPAVMSVFWSVHMFIVLCVYYEVVWWLGALAVVLQFGAAALCYYVFFMRLEMGHLGSAVFVLQWGLVFLFVLLGHGSLRREGSSVAVGDVELWLAPLLFCVVGWVVVLHSYKKLRGGIFPRHLPYKAIYLAYGIATCIQVVTAYAYVTEALRWEQSTQTNFFTGIAMAFTQDLILNEPVKVILLTYADPITKTFMKSALCRTLAVILKEIGAT